MNILSQFDQVELLTVRRVTYLSTQPGHGPSPHGLWSVVGFVRGQVLLAKDGALIKVPPGDVRRAAAYDLNEIISNIAGITNGKEATKTDKTD